MTERKKTGGRKAGAPNKKSQEVIDKLDSLGCDPIEGMARIALQAEKDASDSFKSIIDSMNEAITEGEEDIEGVLNAIFSKHTKERREHLLLAGGMYKELAQYVAPKRKAVEMSGPDGKDLIPEAIKVIYE
jgi:hypothetical protein